MTEFRYVTADQWGITWARPPIAEKLPDPECYLHHTAGPQMSDDAATAFRALNVYAQQKKGYSALDYDIVVHRSTKTGLVTIGEGRGKWMSAATLDRNELGEAVCLIGYFHPGHALSRQPHPDELEGVARGIVWGIENGWISTPNLILGHRDNPAHPGATACPGDWLQDKLPWIRARVAEILAPPAPQPPPDPAPTPGPIIPPSGDTMLYVAFDQNGTGWIGNGIKRRPIPSLEVLNVYIFRSTAKTGPLLLTVAGRQVTKVDDITSATSDVIESLGEHD